MAEIFREWSNKGKLTSASSLLQQLEQEWEIILNILITYMIGMAIEYSGRQSLLVLVIPKKDVVRQDDWVPGEDLLSPQ